MNQYTTKDGDTADYIAWRFYGSTAAKVTERLLEANPGLSGRGPILPGGLAIALPAIETTVAVAGVKLWD